MSPSQEFLIVAIAFYLVECIAAVPRRAIVFRSLWRRRFHAKDVASYPGTDSKALAVRMPLPPLGTFYEVGFFPISLSPEGISNQPAHFLHTSPAGVPDRGMILFENVCDVAAHGSAVWVNGAPFANCGTDATADQLSRFIRRLRDMPKAKRHRRIEAAVRRSLDTERVARVHRTCVAASDHLRFSCSVLCVYLFALCPLTVWLRGLSATWWLLLVALAPIWSLTLIAFVQAHRQVFPTRKASRRQLAALLGCLPLSLIRACDAVTRHALAGYHPLAVSAALCGPSAHRTLAKRVFADLVYPTCENDAAAPAERTKQWMRDLLRTAAEFNLRNTGLDPEDLLAAPVVDDATARSYCPRCAMQFEMTDGACSYCPGVRLREVETGPTASPRPAHARW